MRFSCSSDSHSIPVKPLKVCDNLPDPEYRLKACGGRKRIVQADHFYSCHHRDRRDRVWLDHPCAPALLGELLNQPSEQAATWNGYLAFAYAAMHFLFGPSRDTWGTSKQLKSLVLTTSDHRQSHTAEDDCAGDDQPCGNCF